MEIGGFVVGTSGIIPIVEKTFQIWKSISESKGFGNDMVSIAAQLSMEYYRFLAWARVSQALRPSGVEGTQSVAHNILKGKERSGSFPLDDSLTSKMQAPLLDAAARIVAILEEVSKISEKYAISDELNPPKSSEQSKANTPGSGPSTSVAQGLGTILPIVGVPNVAITRVMAQQRRFASSLQKQSSFRMRMSFGSKPWGQSDKTILVERVKDLCYWNDRLEGLLPQALRNTIEQQAVPGQILLEENKAMLDALIAASEHENRGVATHARFWRERTEFAKADGVNESLLEKYRQLSTAITAMAGIAQSRCELSLCTLSLGEDAPTVVAIEWYPYHSLSWNLEDQRLATRRLAELVHLSLLKYIPTSLRVLKGVCFMDDGKSLGFVTRLPTNVNSTRQPLSLYSLLARDPDVIKGFRPPELGQRIQLAQTLAGAVYSFSLVRWYHKDFNSRNIILFRDTSPTASVILDSPHITGFSISRPENVGEKSLDKEREKHAIYLHPDLRMVNPQDVRPRYTRKYEIYALGLLLFEVGIWRTLESIVGDKTPLPPRKLKEMVVDRCSKDLAFYVGTQYRDVVIRCLTCADEEADETAASLDTIYWSIVLELAKCS